MPGEQLLLINPRRRKRRKNVRRRRVTSSRRRSRARRANPVTHRRRRRRSHRKHVIRARRSNPRRRISHRRRRRNPFNTSAIVDNYLMPGALGAVGGVALGYIWGIISPSLSCTFGSNTALAALAQVAGAVGLGMLASKAIGPTKGTAVGAGAATVVLYNYLNSVVATGGSLAGLGRVRRRKIGAYMPGAQIPRLGAYMPGQRGLRGLGRMGYAAMNPAPFVSDPATAAGDGSEMFGS